MKPSELSIVILTTDTPHHNFLVREIVKVCPHTLILDEQRRLQAPFDTSHPYEQERDTYEWSQFFEGAVVPLASLGDVKVVASVNDAPAIELMRAHRPHLVIDIGTGKVSAEAIAVCPSGIVNLHGGDPQEYRGLDSHMWAIYHGEYEQLVVTLHFLTAELDAGAIISKGRISLRRDMKLYQLRTENVRLCWAMLQDAIERRATGRELTGKPQTRRGRYYSFMPAVLKELCRKKFEKHTAQL